MLSILLSCASRAGYSLFGNNRDVPQIDSRVGAASRSRPYAHYNLQASNPSNFWGSVFKEEDYWGFCVWCEFAVVVSVSSVSSASNLYVSKSKSISEVIESHGV